MKSRVPLGASRASRRRTQVFLTAVSQRAMEKEKDTLLPGEEEEDDYNSEEDEDFEGGDSDASGGSDDSDSDDSDDGGGKRKKKKKAAGRKGGKAGAGAKGKARAPGLFGADVGIDQSELADLTAAAKEAYGEGFLDEDDGARGARASLSDGALQSAWQDMLQEDAAAMGLRTSAAGGGAGVAGSKRPRAAATSADDTLAAVVAEGPRVKRARLMPSASSKGAAGGAAPSLLDQLLRGEALTGLVGPPPQSTSAALRRVLERPSTRMCGLDELIASGNGDEAAQAAAQRARLLSAAGHAKAAASNRKVAITQTVKYAGQTMTVTKLLVAGTAAAAKAQEEAAAAATRAALARVTGETREGLPVAPAAAAAASLSSASAEPAATKGFGGGVGGGLRLGGRSLGGSGMSIGTLLSHLDKPEAISTLAKSTFDWDSYKHAHGLDEELEKWVLVAAVALLVMALRCLATPPSRLLSLSLTRPSSPSSHHPPLHSFAVHPRLALWRRQPSSRAWTSGPTRPKRRHARRRQRGQRQAQQLGPLRSSPSKEYMVVS